MIGETKASHSTTHHTKMQNVSAKSTAQLPASLAYLLMGWNFRADAINCSLDGGIQELGHQQKHEGENRKELEREGGRDEKEGNEADHGQNGFLAEGFFGLKGFQKPSRE